MAAGLAAAPVAFALDAVPLVRSGDVQTSGIRLGLLLLLGLLIAAGAVGLTVLYLCGLRSLPRFDDTPGHQGADTHRGG